MRTMLIALDFSENLEEMELLQAELRGPMEERLDKVATDMREFGVEAQAMTREGEAHTMIVQAGEELGVGCLVMGSHGRTGLRRLIMGSCTEKVLERTGLPVYIVRA